MTCRFFALEMAVLPSAPLTSARQAHTNLRAHESWEPPDPPRILQRASRSRTQRDASAEIEIPIRLSREATPGQRAIHSTLAATRLRSAPWRTAASTAVRVATMGLEAGASAALAAPM